MRQQTQQRFIAAGVLLIIGVGIFFLARSLGDREVTPDDPTPTAEVFQPLFPEQAASLAEVTAVTITERETERTVVLEQTSGFDAGEEGPGAGMSLDWVIIEAPDDTDTGLGVDNARIEQAVFTLTTLTPSRQLNDLEGALDDFGLDPPRYVIEFQADFGPVLTVYVGEQTPTGTGYYVQVPGSEVVSIVSTSSLEPLLGFIEQPPYVQPEESPTPES